MTKRSSESKGTSKVVGLDVGDRQSVLAVLGWEGDEVERWVTVATSVEGLASVFSAGERWRVVVEVGTHTPWIAAALEAWGHEVVVANPRQLALVTKNLRKGDPQDAELLGRLGRSDLRLIRPVRMRSPEVRQALAQVRSRGALVRARTLLVNTARGLTKSHGGRLPRSDARSVAGKMMSHLPPGLEDALGPLAEQIASLTRAIRQMDRAIEAMARERFPQTERLRQVRGVGALTALTFVATIDDPQRFVRARDVGAYLGLVPRRQQSGDRDPSLPITKTGDRELRRLLVQSAQYLLGPFGEDCELRRFGERLIERGGRRAKLRAVIAVARKLAVLLLTLWRSGADYQPLRDESAAA